MHYNRVWIPGETGLVGRAVTRALKAEGITLISAPHSALDLTNQSQTYGWLNAHKPDAIIMAAGRVGGIGANAANQAGFLHDNLAMAQNVIHGAHLAGIKRLIYLGSSCIYPKFADQPIVEESLLTAALEPTNQGYALAKIAGLKLCEFYASQYGHHYNALMPTNLYGPHDNFNAQKSHVIPALMLKIHNAKQNGDKSVTLWGTGKALREFLYVDDLASAIMHVLENDITTPLMNVGSGAEISIHALAQQLSSIIGYEGDILFDTTKPDGTPRKLIDSTKINAAGWCAQTPLDQGLQQTYQWFLKNIA